MVNFNATKEDLEIIRQIADRLFRLYRAAKIETPRRQDLLLDLTATHANGNPLDLKKLLAAPEFDFLHDIAGITRHIDRETGKLTNCFVPRCSA